MTKTKHQIKRCNLVNGFKKTDYLKKDILHIYFQQHNKIDFR